MKVKEKLQKLLLSLCFALLVATAGRVVCLAAGETTGSSEAGTPETGSGENGGNTSETPDGTTGDNNPSTPGENPDTPTTTPEATPAPVKVTEIDYENLWLKVSKENNTAVYYSDKGKKIWSEAMTSANDTGYCLIDISWLKATAATEINLKGDKNEDIVTVKLPARDTKYKIKFDKVKGILTLTNIPSSVVNLQWRKATSYQWNSVTVDRAKDPKSDFAEAISKLRLAGASIYVRTAGTNGTLNNGTLELGTRPGKEIKVSIPKFSNAPKIKIDGAKLTLNTTTAMEYSTDKGSNWTQAEKKLPISKVAPGALSSDKASGQEQIVWIRKKATSRAPESKICVLVIPAQRPAPTSADVTSRPNDGKFCLNFLKASKAEPYEYAVVKPGYTFNEAKVSWKAVTTPKEIALSNRTVPEDSIIYVRKKTVKQSKSLGTEFALASDYMKIPVPKVTTTEPASK